MEKTSSITCFYKADPRSPQCKGVFYIIHPMAQPGKLLHKDKEAKFRPALYGQKILAAAAATAAAAAAAFCSSAIFEVNQWH
jgi:hypothetical protein